MDIQIDGLTELLKKLEHLGGDCEKALSDGLNNGALHVQETAKRLAPYDTGKLRGSISIEEEKPLQIGIGTNVEYAPYVEFGTGTQGDPSVSHTTRESWTYMGSDGKFYTSHGQPPQPFLAPALEQEKENVAKEVKLSLLEAIRERMDKK